ncbi:hypothetical protein BD626DRAFT_241447 [Schizophyllum amplum]|uniref:F-box domain-containing protein n=1 Tax=Schizophyllum amplum TaxID=97359 RepID=A0A550BVY0_9AGAR|nr:hypothetical protein BD626DRAFT_241447 [Auriculariopsis ampla]
MFDDVVARSSTRHSTVPRYQPADYQALLLEGLRDGHTSGSVPGMAQCLADAYHARADYDEDMQRTLDRLKELEVQRAAVDAHIAHMKLLDVPIRRLVPDVLREIFLRVVRSREYSLVQRNSLPLPLSQVCHYWRKIANSDARLWSSIHVSDVDVYDDDINEVVAAETRAAETVLAAVKYHLDRSGNALLRIRADSGTPRSVMQSLLAVHPRWRACTLPDAAYITDRGFWEACGALEQLDVQMGRVEAALAPALRDYKGNWQGVQLPWARLQRLSLAHDHIVADNTFLEILRRSPCLEFFSAFIEQPDCEHEGSTYRAPNPPPAVPFQSEAVVCTQLRELCLGISEDQGERFYRGRFPALLSRLVFPQLSVLTLDGPGWVPGLLQGVALLTRTMAAGRTLDTLDVLAMNVEHTIIRDALKLFPRLRKFSYWALWKDGYKPLTPPWSLMSMLMGSSGPYWEPPDIVPQLECLQVLIEEGDGSDYEHTFLTLLHLVRRRTEQSTGSLKEVIVHLSDCEPIAALDHIRPTMEKLLDIFEVHVLEVDDGSELPW